MHETAGRRICLAAPLIAALGGAALALSGCGTSPADFGITGPSPGMSLAPPAPPPARGNPDATAVIPGVRTGSDASGPAVLRGRATPGTFFGSD